jgi:hypothetical protein
MKFDRNFWFTNWPRVGIVVSVFLLILLFFNSAAPVGSIQWMYWLCLPLYMIHQFEEYIFPGGFEREINRILTKGVPAEILTPKIAFFVNILLIWVLTPILVVLGYFSIIFPLIMVTLVGVNGLTHIVAALKLRKYNPGLIMSILFNIPLSIYVFISVILNGISTPAEFLIGLIIGVILHAGLFFFLIIQTKRKK